MAGSSAVRISGVEELLKHEKFKPAYEAGKLTPTQTKTDRARIITKDTASGLHEKSCIDVVIEKRADNGKYASAVYIRPLEEGISDLLKNTCAKDIKSFEKNLSHIELKDRFLKIMPNYEAEFVFKGVIFWYSYGHVAYWELVRNAEKID